MYSSQIKFQIFMTWKIYYDYYRLRLMNYELGTFLLLNFIPKLVDNQELDNQQFDNQEYNYVPCKIGSHCKRDRTVL